MSNTEFARSVLDTNFINFDDEVKRILKKDARGFTKSSYASTSSVTSSSSATDSNAIGISRCDASLKLDDVITSELMEVLRRVAKKVASTNAKIEDETVEMLVDILVDRINHALELVVGKNKVDSFTCKHCWELIYEPLTLPCGHTYCKNCVKKMLQCRECKKKIMLKSYSSNILLMSTLQKLHSTEYVGRSIKEEGDILMTNEQYESAVLKYMDAMEFTPHSRSVNICRAKAFLNLENIDGAYEDAKNVETFARNMPEDHYTKGEVLLAAKKHGEALMSFLSCLAIDQLNTNCMAQVKKLLKTILMKEVDSHKIILKRQRDVFLSAVSDNLNRRDGMFPNIETTLPPSAKRQKIETSTTSFFNDLLNSSSSSSQGTSSSDSLLTSLLRDIESSLLSDSNLEKYLETTQKETETKQFVRCVDKGNIESSDFECSLCMLLLFNPVCTPCGHTFCRECLERSMDHDNKCPLCKCEISFNITDKNIHSSPTIDTSLKQVIEDILPDEYVERLEQHNEDVQELLASTPVFVCTMAYPTIPCPLHFFEPRYRLLLRRALDLHDRQFGICTPCDENPFYKFGTIVKIRNVSFFPDGRSVVDCVGVRRFMVKSYGKKDGYDTAEIEYLSDKQPEKEEDKSVLEKLLDLIYAKSKDWYDNVNPGTKDLIKKHFGQFPVKDENISAEDGPNWLWWVLAVLPIDDKMKRTIFHKTVLKERLILIHRILACLKKKMSHGGTSS
ncbi:LON peptidase N-terminal domain and RING finger protein 1-like [Styela clava]